MIRSMTGFGHAARSVEGIQLQVDIKSVNHRYNEVIIRMPREWMIWEDHLKKIIQKSIKRGRVDAFISFEKEGLAGKEVTVDWELAGAWHGALEQMRKKFALTDSITLHDLLQIPDLVVYQDESGASDELKHAALTEATEEAMEQLMRMRMAEGSHLYQDLQDRFHTLQSLHSRVTALAPQVVSEYRAKLRQRIEDLAVDAIIDENRLAVEVALLADRSNIDEELTRLQSHFEQSLALLDTDEPAGRKLDFLVQEMNREVNTIGSKANHGEIVGAVVEMKAVLEKIREQVQNIE